MPRQKRFRRNRLSLLVIGVTGLLALLAVHGRVNPAPFMPDAGLNVAIHSFPNHDTALVIIQAGRNRPAPEQELLFIRGLGFAVEDACDEIESFLGNQSTPGRVAFHTAGWPDVEFAAFDSRPVNFVRREMTKGSWSGSSDEATTLHRIIELWPHLDREIPRSIVILDNGAGAGLAPDRDLMELCQRHSIVINMITKGRSTPSITSRNLCELTGGLSLNAADSFETALTRVFPVRAMDPVLSADAGGALTLLDPKPWIGSNPILGHGPVEGARTLTVRDGSNEIAAVALPARHAENTSVFAGFIKALSDRWNRRREIEGLSSRESAWKRLLDESIAPDAIPGRFQPASPQLLMELLTGRVAIDESLQLDRLPMTTARQEEAIAIDALRPPALHHLDYESMVAGRAVTDFPLSRICPADMALLSFRSIDDAFALGDFCDFWASDLGRIYLQEMGTALFRRKLLDRLAIKLDESMRPFYSLAVGEFGFIVNEPSFAATQDVAMVLTPRQPGVIRDRFARYRAEFRQAHPGAREETFPLGNDQGISLTTPDRRLSSFAVFRDDLVVVATSRRTLERILATASGAAEPLSKEADIRLLASSFGENDGVLVLGEKFIERIIGPAWRIKMARRARCLALIERESIRREFERRYWPLDPEKRATAVLTCPDGGVYTTTDDGSLSCTKHGTLDFATPLDEEAIERVTTAEARAYQQFTEQYQRYWSRAMDPIGIAFRRLDNSRLEFHTLILPLIDQSEYRMLQRIFGVDAPPSIEAWRGFPEATVFLANGHNPAAAWLRGEDDSFGSEWNLGESRRREEEKLRSQLDWPRKQPLFGWLGDEWGVFMRDALPASLQLFHRNRSDTPVPLGIFISVRDEGRAARFLDALSRSPRGSGLQRIDRRKRHFRIDNIFGHPVYLGVSAGRLIATLDPALLEPSGGVRLTESAIEDIGDRLSSAGQLMALLNLDDAVLLREWFSRTALFPLEIEECRAARRDKGADCPYGGHWIRGRGDLVLCDRHDGHYSSGPIFSRSLPSAHESFPLNRKLAALRQAGIALKLTPDGLEARLIIGNPAAPAPTFMEFFTGRRGLTLIGLFLLVVVAGMTTVYLLLRERRKRSQ